MFIAFSFYDSVPDDDEMMKLLQVHCCTIQNMSGTLFCLVGVVLWHNPKLHSMYKLNCLSGFSHICMYTSQDKDAGDKASDNKSSYTGSIEEPEPGKGVFPQPLDNICQRGEQIGAGLDPITGKPETTRRKWTGEEKVAVWEKAAEIPGKDATKIRMDSADREIHWDDYGKRQAS